MVEGDIMVAFNGHGHYSPVIPNDKTLVSAAKCTWHEDDQYVSLESELLQLDEDLHCPDPTFVLPWWDKFLQKWEKARLSEPAAVAVIEKAALAMTNELTTVYIMSHCNQMDKDCEVLEKEYKHVLAKVCKSAEVVEPMVADVVQDHGPVQQVMAADIHVEAAEESMEVEPDVSGGVVEPPKVIVPYEWEPQ